MSFQLFTTLAVAVASVAAQSPTLSVNTPTSVQACRPIQLSWNGGTPPYYVSVIPGGQPTAAALKDFNSTTANSLTWLVDQPAGASITVQIRDNNGNINYSDKVNVQPSSDCNTGSAGGGNSSTTTPTAGGTSAAPGPNSGNHNGKSGGSNSSTTSPTPTPNGGSTSTPSGANSPAATAAPSSDASHTIPGYGALVFAAVLAVFA